MIGCQNFVCSTQKKGTAPDQSLVGDTRIVFEYPVALDLVADEEEEGVYTELEECSKEASSRDECIE